MKAFSFIIVLCELIAFLVWMPYFKANKNIKYKLFTIYLGIISIVELLNFFFRVNNNSITNVLVLYLNVPLQFIFIFYYLLVGHNKKLNILAYVFISIYFLLYIIEHSNLFIVSSSFDSFSYGIGSLFRILSIFIALYLFFKTEDVLIFDKNVKFYILIGITIYYIGSFPYNNFRNYFWTTLKNNNTAYILHYLSLSFSGIMYLLFAYAIKWKIK